MSKQHLIVMRITVQVHFFIPVLPFTLDCSWVDLESWINSDWILMEGENASNVDVSLLRKLRLLFCTICLTHRAPSSDSQKGKK